MVKSKKMSKTSVTIIVLALLLVFSLVMGMTGAWFTDRETDAGNKTINFGTINVKLDTATDVGFYGVETGGTALSRDLMPGDYVRANLVIAKDSDAVEDFYFVVKISVKVWGANLTGHTTEDAALEIATKDGGWQGKTQPVAADPEHSVAAVLGQAYSHSDLGNLVLGQQLAGNAYGNSYQGCNVKVTYEVRAIQEEHLSAEQAWEMLTSANYAGIETMAAPNLAE